MNKTVKVISWSLYDFANTIFSMNIVSMYFALWVVVDKSSKDIYYSIALSVSTFFIVILMPLFGVISDKYKRRMPFLIFTIICCAIFTGLIGVFDNLMIGLLFFGFAHFFYHTSLVFYDAMIPQIAGSENRIGKISGYGTAFGYIGAILGLLMVKPFVNTSGRAGAFIPTAVLFFTFSLPLIFLIKDVEKQKILFSEFKGKLKSAIKELIGLSREITAHKPIFIFLLANFLYSDATNTTIVFISIYANKVIGFNNLELTKFLILCAVSAIIFSFFWGAITDKIGAKKSLLLVLLGWCAGLLIAILSFGKTIFYVVGIISGASLSGIWVCTRALLVKITPPEKLGKFFGLYGLTDKLSTIIGPLIWGLVVFIFEPLGLIKYRIAIFVLLGFITAGFFILRKVQYGQN
ncbi:MAG: MFS transporter [Elusimicrobia bacterium]|nr:MFS transporter [Elusimicrobiota bacterium]